jgi:hypothetical protein
LELAARGAFVTRVIYIEDPHQALPVARKANDEQPWFEAAAGEDPLIAADRQGRPVAILRIGGRVPSAAETSGQFVPQFVQFDPAEVAAAQERCCEISIPMTSATSGALPQAPGAPIAPPTSTVPATPPESP